jgi:hypothetical protein
MGSQGPSCGLETSYEIVICAIYTVVLLAGEKSGWESCKFMLGDWGRSARICA